MHKQSLAIIGAGPKALAVACKAHVLRRLGYAVNSIHIFEKNEVGAHWSGKHGFTSGEMPLGTSAEKDLGFPYNSCLGDPSLSAKFKQMMFDYSFHRYLIDNNQYAEWIDRGKPACSHYEFAQYMKWVAQKIAPSVTFHFETVSNIALLSRQWQITTSRKQRVFDALMITGPGNSQTPFPYPKSPHILNSMNYWQSVDDWEISAVDNVAIIGAGESAASIALDLNQRFLGKVFITLITPDGTIHTRGESYSENRIYSDPSSHHWQSLDETRKQIIIARTDRGVFSPTAVMQLDHSKNVHYQQGKVMGITTHHPCKLRLEVGANISDSYRSFDKVIIAMGFDKASMLKQLFDTKTQMLIKHNCQLTALNYQSIADRIDYDLSLQGSPAPLYLPTFAGIKQGPGFENLSSLGLLSDRVLAVQQLGDQRCQRAAS